MSPEFDVAIVGYGPTGAVAAALLGQAGLRVFVCDRQREVYDKPRAIALDHEILRVFQQIGVFERIEADIEPFTDSEYYGADGQLIKCMTTVAPPYPLAHRPSVVFTQPLLEQALRERVAKLATVEVASGAELVELDQSDRAACLCLQLESGAMRTVTASWVIGCDGASSRVRSLTGIALEDLGFDEPWLVVDVLVNERGLAKLPAVSVQYCEPQRPCTYVIGPKNHRRWEISLQPDEDPYAMATPEGVWPLLQRWITPDDAVLWRQAGYRFHALVAENWRAGRVFIAGDAAHQQPPFLGQGMCQGVRDVTNLAWKLIAVLQGRARETLLDTYGPERSTHVRQLTTRIKAIGAVICERDPTRARARDAALLEECGGVVRGTPRQNVQPTLQGALGMAAAHAAVGTLFPQPWVHHEGRVVRLDALTGTGWRLVLKGEKNPKHDWQLPSDLAASLAPLQLDIVRSNNTAWQEADGVLATWFAAHDCMAALVRPDHYVHGVARSPMELAGMLGALTAFIGSAASPQPTIFSSGALQPC